MDLRRLAKPGDFPYVFRHELQEHGIRVLIDTILRGGWERLEVCYKVMRRERKGKHAQVGCDARIQVRAT